MILIIKRLSLENKVPFIVLLFFMCQTALAIRPPTISPPIEGKAKNRTDAAVIIGNEAYQRFPQVIYAANDARAMKAFMSQTLKIEKKSIHYNENSKKRDMIQAIEKMAKRVKKGGTLWIYFAGHGYTKEDGERALVPTDAKDSSIESDAIDLNEVIQAATKRSKLKRLFIMADAGFGNIGRDGLDVYGPIQMEPPNPLPFTSPEIIIWLPHHGSTAAPTFPMAQHGLFTYATLGALRGWADGFISSIKDQHITLGEMQKHVSNQMIQLGLPLQPTQTPLEDAQAWTIWKGQLEAAPTDELYASLSSTLRARRIEELAEYKREQAKSAWQSAMAIAQNGGADGEDAIRGFLEEYEFAAIFQEWTIYAPEVAEAKRLLRNYESMGNIVQFKAEECSDLSKLEPIASKGELSNSQIACIESIIRLNRIQTSRARHSRFLMVNAQAKNDDKRYENLVRRHLERYDRSDPSMTMGFAALLYKKGDAYLSEAMKWADYTLDNRQMWEGGDDFVDNVIALYTLRSEIATKRWLIAENAFRFNQTPELQEKSNLARGQAKRCTREWLDYAKASNRDTDRAFNMCVSAAGDSAFCQ